METGDRQPLRFATLLAISLCWLGLFAASCFLPAYRHPGWDTYDGLACLAGGWIAPAWWANPVSFVAWLLLLCGRYRWASILSTLAVLLALTTPIWFASVAPADELLAGYYVWQSAFVVLAAGCWWERCR